MPILVPRANVLSLLNGSLWFVGTTTVVCAGAANAGAPAAPPPQPTLPSSPAPAEPGARLTIEEAIATALRNHADITVAAENLDAAKARVTTAKTGTLPSVTAEVGFAGRGTTDLGGTFGTGPRSTIYDRGPQPALTARQTLFDQNQTRLQVRQARSSVTSAEGGLRNARRLLAFNVTSDYIQYLRSRQQRLLREEQVRQAGEQLALIDARIQVGDAASSDRFPALREVRLAEQRRIEAQNSVNVSASALRNSMGLPVGPPLELAELGPPSFEVPTLDDALAAAERQRPDLTQDVAAVEQSGYSVDLAKIRRRAQLSATIAAAVTPNDERSRGNWSFLTSVSWPFLDSGLTKARQREAEAGLDSDRARLQQTRKDIAAEVQQALLTLSSAKERVDATKATVDAARVALEVANARFQQGLVRVVDLTDAQVGFFTARNEEINALYDYYQAQAQLDRAVGKE